MKSLACIVGRHRWTTHSGHGDDYYVCSRCGKVSDPHHGARADGERREEVAR
jgi:hypothetical protein